MVLNCVSLCQKVLESVSQVPVPNHARVTPSTGGSLEGNDIHVNIKKYKNDLN